MKANWKKLKNSVFRFAQRKGFIEPINEKPTFASSKYFPYHYQGFRFTLVEETLIGENLVEIGGGSRTERWARWRILRLVEDNQMEAT